MASPVAASVSCCSSDTFTAAEIHVDVNLSHLSRLLSADAGTVLLSPVCLVVEVGTESVRDLGMAAFTLLTKHVCRLEMFSQQNVVAAQYNKIRAVVSNKLTKPRFGCLLRPTAWKWSGFILKEKDMQVKK